MIVDDDPTTTRLLASFLTDNGFSVIVSHDGQDALIKLEHERPDLIILDVVMPDVNGYSFLFLMRKINGLVPPPVIVLTQKADMADIFLAEGVREYLVKPYPNRELLDRIKKYI